MSLLQLTGLSEKQFSEVLAKNPRAYMAVKGAVAEKHLELYIEQLVREQRITSFKSAEGDFDKDFYLTLNDDKEVTLECKNVQVLDVNNSNKNRIIRYLLFLHNEEYINVEALDGVNNISTLEEDLEQKSTKDVKNILKQLPQELRESGIPRYQFSRSLIKYDSIQNNNNHNFISQFNEFKLTIDFQRTRNSTDQDGDTKAQRFYRTDEIDLVGACLFSRTMKWEFVFGHSFTFDRHKNYSDRYSNNLIIKSDYWKGNIMDIIEHYSD